MSQSELERIESGAKLKCAWCGTELEDRKQYVDVIGTDGRKTISLSVCSTCVHEDMGELEAAIARAK